MTYIWQRPDWPRFRWEPEALVPGLLELARERGRLLASVEHLGLAERDTLLAGATAADADGTSTIEGVSLPPASVRSSVAHRLGLDTAGLPPPQRDVDGLVSVLVDATQLDRPLTEARMLGWHAALFPTGHSGMQRIDVGRWRTGPMSVRSGPLGSEQVHFEGPPPDRVDVEIAAFLAWWSEARPSLDGVLRAGIAHLWFETIHPFDDGNGRVGRAIADLALAQADGVPGRWTSLSRAILEERKGYYRELAAAQSGDLDVTAWLLWFVGCVTRAVRGSLTQIGAALRRGRLRQLAGAAGLDPRQVKVLHRLIDAEPEGFLGGLSNANYCSIAGVSKATATRDLAALVALGLLTQSEAGGRSTRYALGAALLAQGAAALA